MSSSLPRLARVCLCTTVVGIAFSLHQDCAHGDVRAPTCFSHLSQWNPQAHSGQESFVLGTSSPAVLWWSEHSIHTTQELIFTTQELIFLEYMEAEFGAEWLEWMPDPLILQFWKQFCDGAWAA